MKIRGLCSFVELDGCIVCNCNLDSLYIAYGSCFGTALDKGKRPVIAVVWDPKANFGRGNFSQCIFHHLAHFINGRNCHWRAISVSAYKIYVINILMFGKFWVYGKFKVSIVTAELPVSFFFCIFCMVKDTF